MKQTNNIFSIFLGFLLVAVMTISTQAQNHAEPCGFDHKHQEALANDPGFAARVQAFNKEYAKYITSETPRRSGEKAQLVTVPIVFHIIHKGEPVGQGSNITEEQVLSSIDGLNIQFRNQFPDGSTYDSDGTDLEFEFCIAQRDPQGNPTNGINRVDGRSVANYDSQGIISSNEVQVKDLSRWPRNKYYNVWVVAMIDGQAPFGSGTKGYAYFPGGDPMKDGTVILFNECGYDPDGSRGLKGNGQLAGQAPDNGTMVHEVGHAFALYHTFQGASSSGGQCPPAEGPGECSSKGDLVCDTDPHESNLGSCKAPGSPNSCTGGTYDVNISRNYMNYTNCAPLIFTPGQRDRVRFALENQRSYFNVPGTPDACIPVFAHDIAFRQIFNPAGFYCDGNVVGEIKVKNNGQNAITSFDIEYGVDATILNTFTWTGNLASQDEITIVLPSISTTTGTHNYFAQVAANSINGSNPDEFSSNDYLDSDFEVIEGSTVTVKVTDFENSDSFEFQDGSGNTVATFSFKNSSGSTFEQDFCLPNDECYTFIYRDALFEHPQVGGTPPSYELIEPQNGFTIESGYDSNPLMTGNPYTDQTTEFCMPYDPGFIIADFDVSQTVVPVNSSITFFDKSKTADGDPATTWKWKFGDGNTSTQQTVNHTYTTPGVYTVQLIADNKILPDTISKKHIIRVVPAITGCDTYNNFIPVDGASRFYADFNGTAGNIPGINAVGTQEYAERFFAPAESKLQKVNINIKAINAVDDSRHFAVKLYDGGFDGSAPGSLLSSVRIPIKDLSVGDTTIFFDDLPVVNQFFFISFGAEDPQDEVIVGMAPFRSADDFSNSAYALDGSSWNTLESIFPGAEASSFDITPTLTFTPSASAFATVQKICAGLAFEVNGTFSEKVNTYQWIFPTNATKTTSAKSIETIAFVEGGVYDIQLNTFGGCNLKDSAIVTVEVDSVPSVTINVTDDICNQGNGTAKAVKRGGSGANDFVWSSDPTNKSSELFGLTPGNYSYTWSDEDCGVSNEKINFTVKDVQIVPEFTTEVIQTSCGFSNGRISAITDGLSNYNFSWSSSTDPTFSSTASGVNNLAPGTYTVTVGLTGCSDRSKTEVILASDSTKGTVSDIPDLCPGETTTLFANGGDSLKWFDLSGKLFAGNVNSIFFDTLKTVRLKVVFYGDPGCTLEKITGLNVLPPAQAFAAVSNGTSDYDDSTTVDMKDGAQVLFSSAGTQGLGFKWFFGDGTSSTSRNPVHRYDTVGLYQVILEAYKSGCDDADTAWVRVVDTSTPTGIAENGAVDAKVYPIPASSVLHVSVAGSKSNQWKIVDAAGRLVKAGSAESADFDISTQELQDGIYFLQIDNEFGFANKRISILK